MGEWEIEIIKSPPGRGPIRQQADQGAHLAKEPACRARGGFFQDKRQKYKDKE
jgi:hypothetical protein